MRKVVLPLTMLTLLSLSNAAFALPMNDTIQYTWSFTLPPQECSNFCILTPQGITLNLDFFANATIVQGTPVRIDALGGVGSLLKPNLARVSIVIDGAQSTQTSCGPNGCLIVPSDSTTMTLTPNPSNNSLDGAIEVSWPHQGTYSSTLEVFFNNGTQTYVLSEPNDQIFIGPPPGQTFLGLTLSDWYQVIGTTIFLVIVGGVWLRTVRKKRVREEAKKFIGSENPQPKSDAKEEKNGRENANQKENRS